MNQPKVSVLMPVFNGEKYVASAVQSILHQTFQDFEFVIVDDGSTDRTREIIDTYSSEKINVITNPHNLGVIRSLNKGIKHCRGRYIARMDADDISLPERLAQQVAFLDKIPTIDIVGTQMIIIDDHGVILRVVKQQVDHLGIKLSSLFFSPLFHPTVMAKRVVFRDNPYDHDFLHAEDYELWSRLLRQNRFHFANIDRPLLKYRVHKNSISSTKEKIQQHIILLVRRENLRSYLSEQEVSIILYKDLLTISQYLFQQIYLYNKFALHFCRKESTKVFQKVWIFYFCNFQLMRTWKKDYCILW